MGFHKRENARPYTPQDGDTLHAIAERETAAGNPITWQELARFNWGTDDEAEVNAFLRDELGCRERDNANNFIISSADERRGQLLIPVRFTQRNLGLEKTYTLRVRRRVAPPQFIGCCSLPGVTFSFNSSFVRPTVVEHLHALEALAKLHSESKIMIFGHTDAVGDDLYNKKLSERRAWSVFAFITNDLDAWEVLYSHPDEHWGLVVIQEILADLGHEAGAPDGAWGPLTRAAMRSFLGLPEDAPVQNDEAFRSQLFAAYMASKHEIDLPSERFVDPGYMGCGEFNPAAEGSKATEANRRVTFLFFHPERLPKLPCAFADVGPCRKQMVSLEARHRPTFRCSFYDSLARRCEAAGTSRDVILLFHVPEEAREHQRTFSDWYVLSSSGPFVYQRTLYARDAEVVAPNRMALVFRDTPLAGRFTLHHFYDQESDYVVFENMTHAELLDHIGEGDLSDEEEAPFIEEDDEDAFLDVSDEVSSSAGDNIDDEAEEPDPDADESWIDPDEIRPVDTDAL